MDSFEHRYLYTDGDKLDIPNALISAHKHISQGEKIGCCHPCLTIPCANSWAFSWLGAVTKAMLNSFSVKENILHTVVGLGRLFRIIDAQYGGLRNRDGWGRHL